MTHTARRAASIARIALWASVPVAPLLVHVALSTGRLAFPATVLTAVQLACAVALTLRRRGPRLAWLAAITVAAALLAARFAWRGSLAAEAAIAHTVLHGSLLVVFARTLRLGQTPLITELARRIHGERSPEMAAYTRAVTRAWCGFFAAQLVASATLAIAAPLWAWSLFVNVLDLPLVVLMFLAEYGYRSLRFRNQTHASPAAILRAFTRRPAPARAPGSR